MGAVLFCTGWAGNDPNSPTLLINVQGQGSSGYFALTERAWSATGHCTKVTFTDADDGVCDAEGYFVMGTMKTPFLAEFAVRRTSGVWSASASMRDFSGKYLTEPTGWLPLIRGGVTLAP